MKYILVFLITLFIVDCFPSFNYTKEERIKKRKELQKKMVECILEGDISESLKIKVSKFKEENSYKIYHLFTSELSESDRTVVRKCRRQMILDMRTIYGGRFGHFFNYSRIHDHFQHHYPHDKFNFTDRHGESNSSSQLINHSDPLPSHFLNHSEPLPSHHHDFNSSHSHSSNSAHSQMHSSNSSQLYPSGSLSHPNSSNANQ